MGKWSEAARALPRVEVDRTGYPAKVNEAKEKFGIRTPGALAVEYKRLRKAKDEAASRVSALNVDIAAVEQLAWDALEDAGLDSVKITGGGSFGVADDITVAMEDRVAFLDWIRENDLEGLMSVNASTISTLVKERIAAKEDLPPGVRVGAYKKTSFRRR